MIGDFPAASYKVHGGNPANASEPVFVMQILVLSSAQWIQNSKVKEGATTEGDSTD